MNNWKLKTFFILEIFLDLHVAGQRSSIHEIPINQNMLSPVYKATLGHVRTSQDANSFLIWNLLDWINSSISCTDDLSPSICNKLQNQSIMISVQAMSPFPLEAK